MAETFMERRSAPAAIKRLQEKPVSGDVQILINDYESLACELEELKRAAKLERPAVEWQPIETAPKDGTSVLGCDGNAVGEVHGVSCGIWSWAFGSRAYPTHWMPLPSPPKSPLPPAPAENPSP